MKTISQAEARRYKAALSLIAENTSGKNATAIARLSLVIAREALQPGYSEKAYPANGAAPDPQRSGTPASAGKEA